MSFSGDEDLVDAKLLSLSLEVTITKQGDRDAPLNISALGSSHDEDLVAAKLSPKVTKQGDGDGVEDADSSFPLLTIGGHLIFYDEEVEPLKATDDEDLVAAKQPCLSLEVTKLGDAGSSSPLLNISADGSSHDDDLVAAKLSPNVTKQGDGDGVEDADSSSPLLTIGGRLIFYDEDLVAAKQPSLSLEVTKQGDGVEDADDSIVDDPVIVLATKKLVISLSRNVDLREYEMVADELDGHAMKSLHDKFVKFCSTFRPVPLSRFKQRVTAGNVFRGESSVQAAAARMIVDAEEMKVYAGPPVEDPPTDADKDLA